MAVESAADRAAFVADFGVSATWTKTDSSTASVTVLIDAKSQMVSGFAVDGTDLITTDYIVEAPASDFVGVVPSETITIDSAVYTIISVEPDAQGWVELRCELN